MVVTKRFKRIDSRPIKKGSFVLYKLKNRLYVKTPSTIESNPRRYYSLNLPNTEDGRARARDIISKIESDYLFDRYDSTMLKYLPHLDKENRVKTKALHQLRFVSVWDAWESYLKDIKDLVKPTTTKYLETTVQPHIKRVGSQPISNAKSVYEIIKRGTTLDVTIRVINRLSTIYKYIFKEYPNEPNPYAPITKALKKKKPTVNPHTTIKPIPDIELQAILDALYLTHPPFGHLVEFMVLTGCRPSEAIGLTWDAIHDEYILLGSSIERIKGQWVTIATSKNGTIRKFPMTGKLRELLNKLLPIDNHWNLVFLSREGKPIDYINFKRRYWSKTTTDYTPYNLRDTFITKQIEQGIPPAIVAKWCDNSVRVIEKHYLGDTGTIKPV
ncbi:hypothetical protein cce_1887 [Crocosphaera subtropica ATCC 51142]|uniref:Tyr recombinase domain-containing protein n=1 Tax=Crocosphaera subtropica (strain ATCC 51142 / BH68) TaxID=43989 RepID=B1X0E8_CROS5|nr:tyrosine-type recombinase/integrase [Crocosphaera subtropica]ACB51237.1 hypothetical protein cce_1887 [Crocosphaera subtropica ATCC 51142]